MSKQGMFSSTVAALLALLQLGLFYFFLNGKHLCTLIIFSFSESIALLLAAYNKIAQKRLSCFNMKLVYFRSQLLYATKNVYGEFSDWPHGVRIIS